MAESAIRPLRLCKIINAAPDSVGRAELKRKLRKGWVRQSKDVRLLNIQVPRGDFDWRCVPLTFVTGLDMGFDTPVSKRQIADTMIALGGEFCPVSDMISLLQSHFQPILKGVLLFPAKKADYLLEGFLTEREIDGVVESVQYTNVRKSAVAKDALWSPKIPWVFRYPVCS